jgi:hypothetical protein
VPDAEVTDSVGSFPSIEGGVVSLKKEAQRLSFLEDDV